MNGKEIIFRSNDEFIEKIAHEVAMASAMAGFNKVFQCDMINSTKESSYIINLYYQHKKWAINELMNNYDCKSI